MHPVWKTLPQADWPEWVITALGNDALRSAWEGNQQLILRGRTFLYRVTPSIESQGHWCIAKVERCLKR